MNPQTLRHASFLAVLSVALAAPALAASTAGADDTQLRTLGKAGAPRFDPPEITWPAAPGEAEICLWKDGPAIPDEEIHAMYRDSLAAINAHVTNNVACCIAYPSGEPHEEIAAQYAIACRGVYGVPNAAGNVNYLNVSKGDYAQGYINALLGEEAGEPKWLNEPLTLKVRLPDTWTSVRATQGGKPVAARIVEHDGAAYALVDAVPDRDEIVLAP